MANNRLLPAIQLRVDPQQIDDITAQLHAVKNGVPKAIRGGINKVLPKAKSTLIKGLGGILTAKRGNIVGKGDKKRIDTIPATDAKPAGTIRIMARPIGLINFKLTDTRAKYARGGHGKRALAKLNAPAESGRGVVVQVRKNEAPIVLPKAFVAVGLSNNRHVFERFGKRRRQEEAHYKPNEGKNRQPIRSFKGESLLSVWRDTPTLQAQVQKRIFDELPKEIDSQVDRILARKKSARPKR